MNNPLSSFDFNTFSLKPNDTNPNKIIELLKEFIDSSQSNLSFVQQASIFLNDERDSLQEYIEDITLHYIYKRIFNDAVILYKNDLNEEIFIKNFIIHLDEQYVINVVDSTLKEEFAKEVYLLIQAPKKSVLGNWSKRLKEYAQTEGETNCYICGKHTYAKERKERIFISEWLLYKENPFYEKIKMDIYRLLGKYKIKKSRNNKYKIIDNIFDIFYKRNTFEYFKKEHTKAHQNFNESVMEIEHNFPKSWGGSKNLTNLYVSCHRCNQNKKDITFYSEYSISRFFSNKMCMSEAAKSLHSKLGAEAILSLKMKQNFKCINDDCSNYFNSSKSFYIVKIDNKKGFYFFNLQIECYDCLKSKFITKMNDIGEDNFLNEYCIKL